MADPKIIGLALLCAATVGCSGAKVEDESDDGGGFYDGGASDGGGDGGDGSTDGAADGGGADGGGTGGADGGGSDAVADGGDDEGDDGGTGTVDGGVDGGGDGASPTPDWDFDRSVDCDGGLSFQIHVIDPSGACTDCAAGPIWLGGAIFNPCEGPLDVTLDGGMVISGGSVEGPSGTGMGWGSGSDGSRVSHTLAPGESLTATETLGDLSGGPWSFAITFGDEGRHSAETERTLR